MPEHIGELLGEAVRAEIAPHAFLDGRIPKSAEVI
jgi:hypothetical protein